MSHGDRKGPLPRRFASAGLTLEDLLLLFGMEGRTGELVVEAGNNIGSLLFHEGRILLAFSPYTRAIGDLLVEQGSLTEVELIDVLKQQRAGLKDPVGALLLKSGKVSFATIEKMVHEQIRTSVLDFSSWKDADFNFLQKDVHAFDSIHLPVYEFISAAIMKSARRFVAGCASVAGPAQPEAASSPSAS